MSPNDPTRWTLLMRLREPNAAAADWGDFDAIYRPFLTQWLTRRGVQPADADDLTQQALMNARGGLPKFRREGTGDFRRWLGTIVANLYRSWLRQRRPEGVADFATLADDDSELAKSWDAEHDAYLVRRLLDQAAAEFSGETIQMFRRYVLDGVNPDDVARECNVKPMSVYQSRSRVLRRLRELADGFLD